MFTTHSAYIVPEDGDEGDDTFMLVASEEDPRWVTRPRVAGLPREPDTCFSYCGDPAIARDGVSATITSRASDLVVGDTNGAHDVFLYDIGRDALRLISVDERGMAANGESWTRGGQSISDDGRRVVFSSTASNLAGAPVPADPDTYHAFLWNADTETHAQLSVDRDGRPLSGGGAPPRIDGTGRWVVFGTSVDGREAIMLVDLETGDRQDILADAPPHAEGNSWLPSIADGAQLVAFVSLHPLVPEDTDDQIDVYLWDAQRGLILVSDPQIEGALPGLATGPELSADGATITFTWKEPSPYPEPYEEVSRLVRRAILPSDS